MTEQKIIRLLQYICFYGSVILLFGFVTHVSLFWDSRPKPEKIFISENSNLHRIYSMGDTFPRRRYSPGRKIITVRDVTR